MAAAPKSAWHVHGLAAVYKKITHIHKCAGAKRVRTFPRMHARICEAGLVLNHGTIFDIGGRACDSDLHLFDVDRYKV